MTRKKISWMYLFEASLEEHLALRGHEEVRGDFKTYSEVMIAFWRSDLAELERLAKAAAASIPDRDSPLALAICLRLMARSGKIDAADVDAAYSLAADPEWGGELLALASCAEEARNDNQAARDAAFAAYNLFKRTGAKKKAVRMLMNAMAMESRIHPDKHYLPDLHFIYFEAKRAGDRVSTGTTLMNISREYQKLGAYSAALKFANRAIAVLGKMTGDLNYCLALVHRAHVYCQLNCFAEARIDTELAAASTFPEVRAAIEVIGESYPTLKEISKIGRATEGSNATPTWNERKNEGKWQELPPLVQKLLVLLADGPRSKHELAGEIYGKKISPESAENRLNNLLNRVRKWNPTLVIFADGKYRFAEDPFLKKEKAS